jgi:acyl-CoA thioester hydrolase
MREVAQNQVLMYKGVANVRVRYAETDQMGIVYYGIYTQYFEVGRVEAFRELGMSYKEMEDNGTMLPVVHVELYYHRPALYDDLLTIVTSVTEFPGVKIAFDHQVLNEKQELLTTGRVVLVFVDAKTKKPKRAPEDFLEKMRPFF